MMTTERINSTTDDDLTQCEAFNAAFYDLGLNWYWNLPTYQVLQPAKTGGRERIQRYLEREHAHMLKAYPPGFLIDAILQTKDRCLSQRAACGATAHLGERWAGMQAQVGV